MSSPDTCESSNRRPVVVPEEFQCPLSGELMREPVLLETGETYDRAFIQKWFEERHKEGPLKCPKSNTVLRRAVVTPNHDLRRKISEWCWENGVELPVDEYKTMILDVTGHLEDLLQKLSSSSVREQQSASASLLSIIPDNKSKAVASGAVGTVFRNINQAGVMVEDLMEILAILSTERKAVEEMCRVEHTVASLMRLTREARSETLKENCMVVLFAMCAADKSKHRLGEICEDETMNKTILKLQQSSSSTPAARDKAGAILRMLRRR